MFTKNWKCVVAVVILAVGVFAVQGGAAQAELFLLDTFNASVTGVGINDELLTRQSGSAVGATGVSYISTGGGALSVNTAAYPGTLQISGVGVAAVADYDFPLYEKVSATFRPIATDESTNNNSGNWLVLGVRGADNSPSNGQYPVVSTDVGAALLVYSTGGYALYSNGSAVTGASGSVTTANTYDVVMQTNASDQLNAWINGTQVITNQALTGLTVHNYVSVNGTCSSGEFSTVDNLQVGVVPEPGTLVLFGMGLVGLLAYAWRKRK